MATHSALIADSDGESRGLLKNVLERLGFECAEVSTGTEASRKLKAGKFDLCVIEIGLTGINGHELAVGILDSGARTVVVILTAVRSLKLARDLLSRGVDDVIYKPTDLEILGLKCKAYVSRNAAVNMQAGVLTTGAAIALDAATSQSGGSSGKAMRADHSHSLNSYKISYDYAANAKKIAEVLQTEPLLANEILQAANEQSRPGDKGYLNLERSVIRLGVAELAS